MICVKCDHIIIDCTCPDITERLLSLTDSFAGPAIVSALVERARSRFTIEQDRHALTAKCHDCESALVFAAARISDELLNAFLLSHRDTCAGELRRRQVEIN